MFWKASIAGGALIFAFLLPGICQGEQREAVPDMDSLGRLVEQWVELRHQIALETTSWEGEYEQLKSEKVLLQKEKKILEAEIAALAKSTRGQSTLQAGLLARKQKLADALTALLPTIQFAEKNLLQWEKRLPPALRRPLEKHFQKIVSQLDKSFSRRLQTILALYAQIEIYQNTIQSGKEILQTASGREIEVEVMYVGLARGFCLSRDGMTAGVATPGLTGWEWEWRPNLTPAIRQAFDYYSHQKIADFIALPMAVSGDSR
ncbi:DUF3450 domain-containing protein [bacterium]|nr:DUF3450 domain-containing protein [bacterium]